MFVSKSSLSIVVLSFFGLFAAGCDEDGGPGGRCALELDRAQADSALPFPGKGKVVDVLTPLLGSRSFRMERGFQPSATSPVVVPDAQSFDMAIQVAYEGGSLRWNKPVFISQEPSSQSVASGYCGPERLQADVKVMLSSNNGAFQESLPGTLFVATDSSYAGMHAELQVSIPSEGLSGAFRVSPGKSENQWNRKGIRLNATWSRNGGKSGWIDVRWTEAKVNPGGKGGSSHSLSERLYTSPAVAAPAAVSSP